MLGVVLQPWSDELALDVFRDLDPNDREEMFITMGCALTPLQVFSGWKTVAPLCAYEAIAVASGPSRQGAFAALSLVRNGPAGTAEASLLARRHRAWRWQLGALAVIVKRDLPGMMAQLGLRRVEARCWEDHPTAGVLLGRLGFRQEGGPLAGFGEDGAHRFLQFAMVRPVDGAAALAACKTRRFDGCV